MSRHTRRPSRTAPAMLGIAAVLGATPIHAQEPIALSRTGGPIVIDGVINERAWSLIPPLHITQKVPVEGDPPSQPTEIRIGYDDDFIYLSGRLYDAEPHRIVANTKKRDDFTENTEWVGLLIDTYDDRENALGFWVTPTGAKLDVAISNDSQNDSEDINTDWNGYWDAATTRDDTGWFAEIRIPFSSLPFDHRVALHRTDRRDRHLPSSWTRGRKLLSPVTHPTICVSRPTPHARVNCYAIRPWWSIDKQHTSGKQRAI